MSTTTNPEDTLRDLRESVARSAGRFDAERAQALHALAWELRNVDATETHQLAEEALTLARALGERTDEAHALVARAYAAVRLSHGAEAITDAEAAVAAFRQLDAPAGLSRALNTLGICYGDSSRFMEALETFLSLLSLCERRGDRVGEADALNNIGIVYVSLDDHAAALEYHMRSLQLAREIGYASGETRSLTNLGSVAYELQRYEEALGYLQESIVRAGTAAGQSHTYGITLVNLGRCYQRLGRVDEALASLDQAHALLDEIDHSLGVAYALDTIGKVKLDQGHTTEALEHLDRSLIIKRKADDRKGQATTLLDVARGHRLRSDREGTEAALSQALKHATAVNARSEIHQAHLQLSELAEECGDLATALVHFKLHSRIRDEFFDEASDVKVRALRVGFEVEQAQKESEIYRLRNVELAKVNHELGVLTRSLREADAQKSRLLKKVERQAREDALTGLGNRRHFDRVIGDAFPRQRRQRRPVSIALCDIDDFKAVNDSHGHAIGDEVLRVVAGLLRSTTRGDDLVARYGGEEFIAMLPDTTPQEAVAVCERMRTAVESYDWSTVVPGVRVTLSLGLASDPTVTHHERLISRADELLYRAKAAGKNCVVADLDDAPVESADGEHRQAPITAVARPRTEPSASGGTKPEAETVLPAGLKLQRHGAPLETVTTQVGSLSLINADPRLELSEGTLDEGGRMTLLPDDTEPAAPELYHVLEGHMQAETESGTVELRAGDTLLVEGLRQTVIFVSTSDVRFLYASPEPSFHHISNELDELRRLAVEVEFADGYTAEHCQRLQTISYAIGRELGLPQHRLHLLDYAAYLHDVGKVRVPSAILTSPAPLSDEDWESVRRHPTDGAALLEETFMAAAAPIVAQHHERLDGSGYPLGLRGDDIVYEAYIVAVADTFDAMTSDRPYRRALPREAALAELRRLRGKAFPAEVVDTFERVLPRLSL